MILVFGGAYQGKLDFAKALWPEGSVCDLRGCASDTEAIKAMDFSADIICGLDAFAWSCTADGREAAEEMRRRKDLWQDKILIITDVSQGIVPIDARERAFREMNGRLMMYLAKEAKEVYRVFCGIGKQIRRHDDEETL